ncbi:MAG: hypothetical protein ACI9K2_007085, partial [Myxococcota bacterium]
MFDNRRRRVSSPQDAAGISEMTATWASRVS